MPETLTGPCRDLSHLSDQELLELHKTATFETNPDLTDICRAFSLRHKLFFNVTIYYNMGQMIGPVKLIGPVELLEAQGLIHPIVMDLIKGYVKNQAKEDLYFFVDNLHLGGEIYTICS